MGKQILKWVFVVALLGMIVYGFRDMAGPILEQLRETSPFVVVAICLCSTVYEWMEGQVTYGMAREYQPAFTRRQGVESAFYCSFYRTATLGSGTGVAAIYYFNEKGIPAFCGTGMYMMEYVLHKLSIALFSAVFFLFSFSYMMEHFSEYFVMLLFGYGLTFVIAVLLVLGCCSRRFHGLLLSLMEKINRKGWLTEQIVKLKEQFLILESTTTFFLRRKKLFVLTILKNFVKLAFWYGIPFLILHGKCDITLTQTLAITSLSVMVAAVLPVPAGIGSTEFVMTLLFSTVADADAAGAASILYRFATFVFPFLVGTVVVLLERIRKKTLKTGK